MICPNCGKEIAKDSQFCEYCGAKLNIVSSSDTSHALEESKLVQLLDCGKSLVGKRSRPKMSLCILGLILIGVGGFANFCAGVDALMEAKVALGTIVPYFCMFVLCTIIIYQIFRSIFQPSFYMKYMNPLLWIGIVLSIISGIFMELMDNPNDGGGQSGFLWSCIVALVGFACLFIWHGASRKI